MTLRSTDRWKIVPLFLAAALAIGCERQGPAERAGENLDEAGRNLRDAVDPSGPGERAGEAVDDALGN